MKSFSRRERSSLLHCSSAYFQPQQFIIYNSRLTNIVCILQAVDRPVVMVHTFQDPIFSLSSLVLLLVWLLLSGFSCLVLEFCSPLVELSDVLSPTHPVRQANCGGRAPY